MAPTSVERQDVTPGELHQAVAPLSFLLGTWKGTGRGEYPTIESFTYFEEIRFDHIGKPFLTYQQRTRSPEGLPLHTEFGYIRPVDGGVELILAQPTGVTEIHTGTLDGGSLVFVTFDVGLSPTAKEVRSVRRSIAVDGDTLSYRLDMAAVGQDEQFHLEASLSRQ
jgi:hypothetical protein